MKHLNPIRAAREQIYSNTSLGGVQSLFWWIEINTAVPLCTYYFGPFESEKEARDSRSGYIDDLYQEQARGIIALVKQCQPGELTLDQGYYPIKICSVSNK